MNPRSFAGDCLPDCPLLVMHLKTHPPSQFEFDHKLLKAICEHQLQAVSASLGYIIFI